VIYARLLKIQNRFFISPFVFDARHLSSPRPKQPVKVDHIQLFGINSLIISNLTIFQVYGISKNHKPDWASSFGYGADLFFHNQNSTTDKLQGQS